MCDNYKVLIYLREKHYFLVTLFGGRRGSMKSFQTTLSPNQEELYKQISLCHSVTKQEETYV